MTNERLMEIINDREQCEFCPDCGEDSICIKCERVRPIAVYELREYYGRLRELAEPLTQPEPLSLETLRQMDKEPLKHWVWIEHFVEPDKSAYYRTCFDYTKGREFCCGYPGMGYSFEYNDYGKTWLAFDRELKEE